MMRWLATAAVMAGVLLFCSLGAVGQASSAPPSTPSAAPAPEAAAVPVAVPGLGKPLEQQVTLALMFKWGGPILWCLMLVGFVALAMSVYFILTVTVNREVPGQLSKHLMAALRSGDLRSAYQLCQDRDELLAKVARAGLRMSGHDRYVIQDAMESEGERGVMDLSQKIFYLNNIGTVAPLIGLLGTVWGFMLSFSSMASDNAQVKSMVVASGISKAMICTVSGLVVAIPALSIYYYLRGRVVKIIASVEAQSSEIIELLARGKEQ